MPRLSRCLSELETISPDVAWILVDRLFRQKISMIVGANVFMVLGVLGFLGTGSFWYLVGLAYTVWVFAWRFWQASWYARARETASPATWAWRSIRSGWATAIGWGAWSAVVVFEPKQVLVTLFIGMHAGLVVGGAVRNATVRAAATGQVFLACVPLFVACIASGNPYLEVYGVIVALHIVAALTLVRFLHGQTLQLLLKEAEKSDLVARLEVANQDLEAMNQHLESQVITDPLTGVANRRAFDIASSREWRRGLREQRPLSLLLLDVDYFKAFNDFYGHQAGDHCLRTVARIIGSAIQRGGDIVARYGGEEFAVILPDTCIAGATQAAEQIRNAFTIEAIAHDASPVGHVSVSIGVVCTIPSPNTSMESLISLADAALYAAKRGGRNRVHAAEVPDRLQKQPAA